MTRAEKRASLELLNMLIEHELSLGYKEADADFIMECVNTIISIKGIVIDQDKVEREKMKTLELMRKRMREQENGGNTNTKNS